MVGGVGERLIQKAWVEKKKCSDRARKAITSSIVCQRNEPKRVTRWLTYVGHMCVLYTINYPLSYSLTSALARPVTR